MASDTQQLLHTLLHAVLDENAQTLFMTELMRGMMLALKMFFEPKFTVRTRGGDDDGF